MARLDLIVDASQAKRGFREAEQSSERFQRSARQTERETRTLRGSFRSLKDSIFSVKGAIGATAGALATGAFASAVRSSLGQIEDLRRQARGLGADFQELQRTQFALGQFEIGRRETIEGINELNDRVQEAVNGAGEFQEKFEQAGISLSRLRDQAPVERLKTVINELSSLENVSQRNATAIQLFGDEFGNRLIPLLAEGEGAINDLQSQADELGITLGDEASEAAAEASRNIRTLRQQFSASFNKAVAGSADEFSELSGTLKDKEFQEGLSSLVSGFKSIASFGVDTVEFIGKAATELERFNAQLRGVPIDSQGQLEDINQQIENLQENLQGVTERQNADGLNKIVLDLVGPDLESQEESIRSQIELLRERKEVLKESGRFAEEAFTELRNTEDAERRLELARRLNNLGAAQFVPEQLRERAGIGLDRSDAVGAPANIGSQGDFVAQVQQDVDDSNKAVTVPANVDLSVPDPLSGVGTFSADEIAAPPDPSRLPGESTEAFVQRQQSGFATPESIQRGRTIAESFGINKGRTADSGIGGLQSSLPEVTESAEQLQRQLEETDESANTFATRAAENIQDNLSREISNIVQNVDSIGEAFRRVGDSIVDTLTQTATQIASQQLATAAFGNVGESGEIGGVVGDVIGEFGGGSGGGSGGGFLSGLGSLFGGFFADGGRLEGGKFGVVGERGPEVIRPANDAQITPLGQGGGNQVVNVQGNGAETQRRREGRDEAVDVTFKLSRNEQRRRLERLRSQS